MSQLILINRVFSARGCGLSVPSDTTELPECGTEKSGPLAGQYCCLG